HELTFLSTVIVSLASVHPVVSSSSYHVHRFLHSFPTRRSSDLKWLETNNLFNNLIQRNQSAAFSSGKVRPNHETNINIIARPLKIGRAVQQECRDRSRMPSSACKQKNTARRVSDSDLCEDRASP